jgi:hypothetical protein
MDWDGYNPDNDKTLELSVKYEHPRITTFSHAPSQLSPDSFEGQESELGSVGECKVRCSDVEGCVHFSYWQNGKGCRHGVDRYLAGNTGRGCCYLHGKSDIRKQVEDVDQFISGEPFCTNQTTLKDCTCSLEIRIRLDVMKTIHHNYNCEIHTSDLSDRDWAECTSYVKGIGGAFNILGNQMVKGNANLQDALGSRHSDGTRYYTCKCKGQEWNYRDPAEDPELDLDGHKEYPFTLTRKITR